MNTEQQAHDVQIVFAFKAAFLTWLGTDSTETVEKRDGSAATIDYAKIPADLLITFLSDGCKEYVRDSASSALSNAYDIAHPDHKLTGDKLKTARIKWVGTDDNVFKVRDESSAIMSAAIGRMEAGERRVARGSAYSFTAVDDAVYDAAVAMKSIKGFEPIAVAWKASTGGTTAERKLRVLSAVVDDLPEPVSSAIHATATAHVKSMAALAASVVVNV